MRPPSLGSSLVIQPPSADREIVDKNYSVEP